MNAVAVGELWPEFRVDVRSELRGLDMNVSPHPPYALRFPPKRKTRKSEGSAAGLRTSHSRQVGGWRGRLPAWIVSSKDAGASSRTSSELAGTLGNNPIRPTKPGPNACSQANPAFFNPMSFMYTSFIQAKRGVSDSSSWPEGACTSGQGGCRSFRCLLDEFCFWARLDC